MFGLGAGELIAIIVILLLMFGARRLPEIAAGLGSSVSSFKRGLKQGAEEDVKTITPQKQIPTKDGDEPPEA